MKNCRIPEGGGADPTSPTCQSSIEADDGRAAVQSASVPAIGPRGGGGPPGGGPRVSRHGRAESRCGDGPMAHRRSPPEGVESTAASWKESTEPDRRSLRVETREISTAGPRKTCPRLAVRGSGGAPSIWIPPPVAPLAFCLVFPVSCRLLHLAARAHPQGLVRLCNAGLVRGRGSPSKTSTAAHAADGATDDRPRG